MVEPWGRCVEEHQHELHSQDQRPSARDSRFADIPRPHSLLDGTFPTIDRTFIASDAAFSSNPQIRIDIEDRIPTRVSSSLVGRHFRVLGVIVAALLTLGALGWVAGSKFGATLVSNIQVAAPQNSISVTSTKSDREDAKSTPSNPAITADSAPTDSIAALLKREGIRSEPAARSPNPQPAPRLTTHERTTRTRVPETKPATIDGWSVREVQRSVAVLVGPTGVWTATMGDTVPGVGKINSIVRWGDRWIVATSRGLISTP
jgi:hypothetical protein